MKIKIDSRDLPYTIDTYSMFTGDNSEEGEQEYYASEYDLTESEQFSIAFDYNHEGIVKALANESVNLLDQNLIQHNETDGIVKSISMPIKTRSPQFYNYTTDSYVAEWDIDYKKLQAAVKGHVNKEGQTFQQYLTSGPWHDHDQDDTLAVAMLDFWLPSVYSVDDYNMVMFERETEAYYENRNLDADSQKLIDSKTKVTE